MQINENDIYIVNPVYKFRNDIKRVILTNNNSYVTGINDDMPSNVSINISWSMHPHVAYIFSFFDGTSSLKEIADEFEQEWGMSKTEFMNMFLSFIENKEDKTVPILNHGCHSFPKRFLVKKTDKDKPRDLLQGIDLEEMEKVDMTSIRQHIPNQISIMLNNTCVVDCEYCYADKSHMVENKLPFSRIKELIAEAYHLGLRDVEIGGGEFFLYEHWKELIQVLHKYTYTPYISTKHPVTKDMVDTLLGYKIKTIQLSIDSVNSDELKRMLHVGDNYLQNVIKGVRLLDEAGIKIVVKPVITKYNDSILSFKNLMDFLLMHDNVKTINIAPGSYSIYKPFTFSTTVEKMKQIQLVAEEYIYRFPHVKINVQGYESEVSVEEKQRVFANRSICSGNQSSFYTLPDGKVTICEQMYWQPFFIMGDLSKQSIMEVWNSQKALSLWNYSQDEVRPESPCKTCTEFEQCRRGRGNCWRIAIAAYGESNYDYPAPNCPMALPVMKPYYMP